MVPGCPGHFQVFGLFNNAKDGSILKVYSVDIFNTLQNFIHFSLIQGNPGINVGTTYGSIDPLSSKLWGQPFTSGSAVLLGTDIGGITVQASVSRNYTPGWPAAKLQPGWSFMI